ncbi:MAG TPA: RICIN domain-containing protein, partial [Polyangia bacterium]|nr:RICIN domain-containing protein [Polyangia bacterium]
MRSLRFAVLAALAAAAGCLGSDLADDGAPATGAVVTAGLNVIRGVASGKCVQVVAGGTTDGTLTEQADCNGGAAQQWRFRDTGNNSWEITSLPSGKCLDVQKVSNLNGARIQIWACGGGAN